MPRYRPKHTGHYERKLKNTAYAYISMGELESKDLEDVESMKILKLKLENFQGVKEFEVAPDGKSCSLYGDNGTGKSTVYNAFTWLMYGKPSTGEKNYTPKTTDSHHLHHVVEMVAELENGVMMTLRKDFHEVYKTIKGSAKEVFAGHTTDYYIDGVPVNETMYKRTLMDIYHDEELAKMLTMYDYFLEVMKVADRRKMLLQVCGGVEFDDVISSVPELAELPDMMRKPGNTAAMYTVDEYQAIAAKEKSRIDKALKNIPLQINEAERAKPDLSGLSEQEIRRAIKQLREQRRQLESDRAAGDSMAEATIRSQITEIERQMAASEAAHVKAEADKNKGAYERISNLRYTKSDRDMAVMRAEQDIQYHKNEVARLNRQREMLLKEWQDEDTKQWTGSEICPTCKQPLPADQVAAAKEAFNVAKAKCLEEINRRGMEECSNDMIAKENAEIARLETIVAEDKQKLAEVERCIAEAQRALVTETPFTSTEDYRGYTQQIAELQLKLKDMSSAAQEANTVLNQKIASIDQQIEAEEQKLAQIAFADKQEKRIDDLRAQEKDLAAQYERVQYGIHLCELYTRTQAGLLDEKINSRFKTLKFRLFIEQQNGGIADDCEALVPCASGLVPFKSANNAARINAGLEVIDTLAEYYGLQMPVFIDNAESVTRIQHTDTQVIRLVVSETDKALRFEKGDI